MIKYLLNVNSLDSPTFTPTTHKKEEIDNHRYFSCSFGISTKGEEMDLPAIPTGFLNCTSVLTNSGISLGLPNAPAHLFPNYIDIYYSGVKIGFQRYCDTCCSWNDVNQMWILKYLKDLLKQIQSRFLSFCNGIKTFVFSILYTNIPPQS